MIAFVRTARRRCCSSFMISVLVLRTFPSEVVLTGLPDFSGCGKTGLVPSVFEMFTMKIKSQRDWTSKSNTNWFNRSKICKVECVYWSFLLNRVCSAISWHHHYTLPQNLNKTVIRKVNSHQKWRFNFKFLRRFKDIKFVSNSAAPPAPSSPPSSGCKYFSKFFNCNVLALLNLI